MKQSDKRALLSTLAVTALLILAFAGMIWQKHKEEKKKSVQIDTVKVQILYEDTWGKILMIKNEDL